MPSGLPMFFQFPLQKGNYKTSYVGFIGQEAVILQLPMNPGINQLLADSYAIVIRFVHEGLAYGFETKVLAVSRKPVPLLFLNFPVSVHQVKLRECERLSILEKAVLTVDGEPLEGIMTDISCGGCKIKLPRTNASAALSQGAEALVEFGLSMDERVALALKGTILHVDLGGKKVKCRVAFSRDQGEELTQLATFLQNVVRLLRE
jgi:c-di-GMP-binding flagellar brake protein YcgR